jgi:hypothetical protein
MLECLALSLTFARNYRPHVNATTEKWDRYHFSLTSAFDGASY